MGDDFKLDVLKQALKTQRSEAQQREEALQNQLNGLWQVRVTPCSRAAERGFLRDVSLPELMVCMRGVRTACGQGAQAAAWTGKRAEGRAGAARISQDTLLLGRHLQAL
jgi:hypothetical protein